MLMNSYNDLHQMDSYFNRDDHVVPQAEETSDLSSSLDDWFQCGEGFSNLSKCGEFPKIDYCGGKSEEISLHRTGSLGGWSDDDQIDNIFMSSFHEEVLSGMSYDSESNFDNLLTDMINDSQSISRDESDIHSSKYLKMSALPLSTNLNELDDSPHFMSNTGQRQCSPITEAPFLEVLMPGEPNAPHKEDGHMIEQVCLEETMLHDLDVVMKQWTQKTRICCRDAMYRLAKSSKQRRLQSQDEPRLRKSTFMESEMRTFDSTIAHLLFNNLNCDTPIFPM